MKKLKQQLAEVEERLEHCTVEEYPTLARQYSILLNRIETEKTFASQDLKTKAEKAAHARMLQLCGGRIVHSLNK